MNAKYIKLFIAACIMVCSVNARSQNINKHNILVQNGLQVNTFSGNLFYKRTDLKIPCTGNSIDLTFCYNNSVAQDYDYGFGKGWTMTYTMLYMLDSNKLILGWGDGRRDIYSYNGSHYSAPPGIFDSISEYSPGKFRLTTKSGMNYFFDDSSHKSLTSVRDRNNNLLQISYLGNLPLTVTDPSGKSIQFQYSGGHLIKVTDPNSTPVRHILYENDSLGRPVKVTDPAGNSIRYEYDSHDNMIKFIDQSGFQTLISYFNFLFTRQIVSPLTNLYVSYDTSQMQTTVSQLVNSVMHSYTYDYDTTGNLRDKSDNCCGFHNTYSYDAQYNVTQKTDGNGNLYIYTYDSRGNVLTETDPMGSNTSYTYEPVYNKVTSITDKRGNTTTYSYDANGNLLHENKPLGISLHYTYDSPGNLITSTDGRGNTTQYEYNSSGYMTKTTYPDGAFITYTYDNVGNLTSFGDANGHVYSFQYDPLNRKVKDINPNGNFTTYTYDSRSNLITTTDPLGHVTSYTYDALNRMTSTTTPAGTASSTYDEVGNVISSTDGNGNLTRYFYDTRNLLITEINPNGNSRTYSYDGNGNKLSATDFSGNTTNYQYDALNRMIRTTDALSYNTFYTYDVNGNRLSVTDANGHITTYTYDALNRNTQIQRPVGLTTMSYDANGNVISTTDPRGNVTTSAYDSRDRVITVTDAVGNNTIYTYDPDGNLISSTDRNGHTTAFSYDALDRRVTVTNPTGDVTTTGYNADNMVISVSTPEGNLITYTYDAAHRLTSASDLEGSIVSYTYDANSNRLTQTDGNGHTSVYTYDALNRLITEIDPMGKTTSYLYNNNSNLISTTDRNGNTTLYNYDAVQRRTSVISPLGNVTSTFYDGVGNVTSVTDPRGNITSYSYDANDRLISENYPNGTSRTYIYDAGGNRTSRTDNIGAGTLYSYDALNRLVTVNYPGPNDNTYSYDNEGNLTTAVNSNAGIVYAYDNADRKISETMNGKITSYSYNISGRKRNITYPGGRNIEEGHDRRMRLNDVNEGAGLSFYTYDAGNRGLTRSYGNGIVTQYTYNNNNWTTSLIHKKSTDTAAMFRYEYDFNGNRNFEEKLHHPSNSEKYHYDAEYRLDSFKVGMLNAGNISSPVTATKYSYDAAGNRTSINNDTTTTTYTANSVNAYTNITDSNSVNPVYDMNGNVLNDGRFTYTYDFENRILTVDGGSVAVYQYDAMGRRIQKVTPSGTANYFYDDMRIIEERDGSDAVSATYVYGISVDDVINMVRSGNSYFYLQNSLGSVIAVTDDTGAVRERYEYDAYGKPEILDNSFNPLPGSTIGNSYLFTGREFDIESGNYYYRARYYKYDWGRFGQWDPIGYYKSMNLYEYVRNNPVNLTDPFGKELVDPNCINCLGFATRIYSSLSPDIKKKESMKDVMDKLGWSCSDVNKSSDCECKCSQAMFMLYIYYTEDNNKDLYKDPYFIGSKFNPEKPRKEDVSNDFHAVQCSTTPVWNEKTSFKCNKDNWFEVSHNQPKAEQPQINIKTGEVRIVLVIAQEQVNKLKDADDHKHPFKDKAKRKRTMCCCKDLPKPK